MKSRFAVPWMLATVGLAGLFAWGAYALAAPGDRYEPPPVGSTYTYTVRTTGSYGNATTQVTVRIEEREWEGKRMRASVTPQGVTIFNAADGGWVVSLAPDGKPALRFDPPLTWQYPLVVGKTTTTHYKSTVFSTQKVAEFDATVKVEAFEDVTVPAGTFKVFRVSWKDTSGNDNMEYAIPGIAFAKRVWRRTDKHSAGPGTREIELVSYSMPK